MKVCLLEFKKICDENNIESVEYKASIKGLEIKGISVKDWLTLNPTDFKIMIKLLSEEDRQRLVHVFRHCRKFLK